MLRKILIIVIGLVIILAAAAFIIPSLIPAEVYRAQIQERATAALGRPVTIAGAVRVTTLPSIQARAEDVTIANEAGFSAASLAHVEQLRAQLAILPLLARRVEIKEFILVSPEISLEVDAQGRNNWTFSASDQAQAQAPGSGGEFRRRPGALPFDAALGDVRITKGSASYIDRAAGVEHQISKLEVTVRMPGLAAPLEADANFALDEAPVRLSARLDSLRSFFDGAESPFTADLTTDALEFAIDGRFEAGEDVAFSGDVRLASDDLRALAATAGSSLPEGDVYERFAMSGRASGGPERLAFEDADITFDAIRGRGDFVVDLAGARPNLAGELALGPLDVTPYIPEGGGAGAGGGAGGVAPWSEEPIDVTPLRLVDADFTLRVESLKAQSFEFGASTLRARLANGRLQVDLQELNAYEGSGQAQLVVDASGATPRIDLSADLANIQAQPLLQAAARFDRLVGAGDGRLNLTATGGSQAALMRSLDGTGGFDFHDGALRGVNLAAAVRGLSEALQGDFSLEALQRGASTDFTDLIGQFTVEDGVARLSAFNINSPLVRVTGSGALDIGEQAVDLHIQPRAVASIEGQGGATDLQGLGVPLRLSGPWGAVRLSIDQEELQRMAARRARDAVGGDAARAIDEAVGGEVGGLVRGALGLPEPPSEDADTEGAADADAAGAADSEDEDPAEQLIRGLFGRDE